MDNFEIKLRVVFCCGSGFVLEILDGGVYFTKEVYTLKIGNEEIRLVDRTISFQGGLKQNTVYHCQLYRENRVVGNVEICTKRERVVLNVRDFGARGDGIHDDTVHIQAAIMACPINGRVWIERGDYKVRSLFLKSDLCLELGEGARLLGDVMLDKVAILPGEVKSELEDGDYPLGNFEGLSMPMYTGILNGFCVERVTICGKGVVDGNASFDNWWNLEKPIRNPGRPRLLYLNGCKDIIVTGIIFQNSPSWHVHPIFCENLNFWALNLKSPWDSPNTDGIDPESCSNVKIEGVRFSLGDDCIAIKSGQVEVGVKYKTPSKQIEIRQCFMEHGHGGITIGSEISGGVYDIEVKECILQDTDRGIRVKTRRGRGNLSIVDRIFVHDINMDRVKVPFVINSYYFCNEDGHSDYVQSKLPLPVDDRTPKLGHFRFEKIKCENCWYQTAFFYGLPEQPIEKITMKEISFTFDPEAKAGLAAMLDGIEPIRHGEMFVENVRMLDMDSSI